MAWYHLFISDLKFINCIRIIYIITNFVFLFKTIILLYESSIMSPCLYICICPFVANDLNTT